MIKKRMRLKWFDMEHALFMARDGDVFFDRETGEILWRTDFGDDLDNVEEKLEEDPDRYAYLERRESWDEYAEMERFAESVDEENIQELLFVALNGRGAFGRFRDVLYQYPDLSAEWHQRKEQAERQYIEESLASIGIEPIWEEPPKVQPAPAPAPPSRKKRKKPAVVVSLVELLAMGGQPVVEDGVAVKQVRVKNDRQTFNALARQLCELHGIGWRKRFIENRSEIEVEGMRLRHEKGLVEFSVPVRGEVAKLFGQ